MSTHIKNPLEEIHNVAAAMELRFNSISKSYLATMAQVEKPLVQLSSFSKAAAEAKAAYESISLVLNRLDFVDIQTRDTQDQIMLPTEESSQSTSKKIKLITSDMSGTFKSAYSVNLIKGKITAVSFSKKLPDLNWLTSLHIKAVPLLLNRDQTTILNNLALKPHLSREMLFPVPTIWKPALKEICASSDAKEYQWEFIKDEDSDNESDRCCAQGAS
ncbi:hypothetical protein KPH14_008401 [Odynerus spinipes]|uniref:Uncharacterized protein n=1 Tax=Odynerus spinipes TaxID=1348599 RepID=A0AAD9VIP5_9HYME|nr:hypothetical protein KPH14_008401 [Odynerus spinipes]